HHGEALRLQHEAGGQDVDVLLVDGDLGVVLADRIGTAGPPRHADGDAVAFGGDRQVLARARLRQIVGVPQHAVGAEPAEHRFLDHDLALGPRVHDAAQVGVLALGVLAHDVEVDVAG